MSTCFGALLALSWICSHTPTTSAQGNAASKGSGGVSGQGEMTFRVLYTADHLPAEAQKVLTSAHGGFSVDLRPQGRNLLRAQGSRHRPDQRDLKTTRLINTSPEMKDKNLHNTTLWYGPDGSPT